MAMLAPQLTLPADLRAGVDHYLEAMQTHNLLTRIWAQDHEVWQPEPTEITNRLGWLDIAERMLSAITTIRKFGNEIRHTGYTDVVVLGMGGSSLAPELFAEVFDGSGFRVWVLDSTAPETVLELADRLLYRWTLFIVSSKSGGTVETVSFFKYFYNLVLAEVGPEDVGNHFVSITDPGSNLGQLAHDYGFRRNFVNDPEIGGRYSALSFFGLVPAQMSGAELEILLQRAHRMAAANGPDVEPGDAPGVYLGAVLGAAAQQGRDKLTLVMSPGLRRFADWIEQLVAESTGKNGTGIVPIVGERIGGPSVYGNDRLFVHIRLAGDDTHDAAMARLAAAGQPVVHYTMVDVYALGGEIWRWEMATAVAGHILGINPFDQPNVESAKVRAKEMVAAYRASGALPAQTPLATDDGLTLFAPAEGSTDEGERPSDDIAEPFRRFLAQIQPGDYVALQAYLPYDAATASNLDNLRRSLLARYHVPTTLGYGPRFLHSTGQLHKGGANNGLFLLFTAENSVDAPIPNEPGGDEADMTFGVLLAAQALGDMQALQDAGRRVLRVDLGDDILSGLRTLALLVAGT